MSKGITLSQLLARPDNEIRTLDAAKVARRAGFILEAQLEDGGAWFRVHDVQHKHGLRVFAGGTWHRPYRVIYYRTIGDYNNAVRERNSRV